MRRRRTRRRRSRVSTFTAGLLGIAAIVVFSYLAYTKFANPFASQTTMHAVFSNANGLRPDSLVRIAGVNVGKVTGIAKAPGCAPADPGKCQAADVTMQIDGNGLPIHQDATFSIRPRIFLEGNFFVDVSPGSPSAPVASDGYTFPIQQGTEPVQIDQVLTSLQSDTRHNLQILLKQFGTAVKQGGPAYNRSVRYWLPAYEYSAIVAHDALGLQPHDLSGWIAQMGTVSAALDAHPQNLQSLITDFNTTANAFARQNAALQSAVAELPRALAAATPAFNALNAAFPPLRAFARALMPGVQSAGPAIDTSLPFINQLRLLVQPAELRGLTSDLAVTVPALAQLAQATIPLMANGVRPASSCVANVIYPWSQLTLNDPNFNASNGFPPHKAFIEAVDFLPGLAGESRNFDANGPYIRILGTGGTFTYSLQPGLFGQALSKIVSVQPQLPPGGRRPPLMPTVPCETQAAITDLSAPSGPPAQQVATDLSAPGASLRARSAAQSALGMVRDVTKQQGLGFKNSTGLTPVSSTGK
jgi:virulence factor Mce-like protein